ncbi:hypothetical protein [Streptomyces sannanensis]|uniref:hypothetical protein n=1 Tax=Streptomyces sannanensis TaxID=285536 RepID=UPI0031F0D0E0
MGSSIAEAAYGLLRDAPRELLAEGTCGRLAGGYEYGQLNALMSGCGQQASRSSSTTS